MRQDAFSFGQQSSRLYHQENKMQMLLMLQHLAGSMKLRDADHGSICRAVNGDFTGHAAKKIQVSP